MKVTNRTGLVKLSVSLGLSLLCMAIFASCATRIEIPKHLKPVSQSSLMLLGKKKMKLQAPIFIRIFKQESELEIWKKRRDGRFYHFKTYPICTWSGELGPKRKQGDKQAPEGFYTVRNQQMNPNSSFHLSFNLGYPNAYDRAHGRTGNFLMVHGKCTSAGCYAMTDPLIEEIYALAREAFEGGQEEIHVHAFPFRMTQENMLRHIRSPEFMFWQRLKEGYDYFELTHMPPQIAVCDLQYHVNVSWEGDAPDATRACPALQRMEIKPFFPVEGEEELAQQRITVAGVKKRRSFVSKFSNTVPAYGLSQRGDPSAMGPNVPQDAIGAFIRLSSPAAQQ